jgi:hypothetical protein
VERFRKEFLELVVVFFVFFVVVIAVASVHGLALSMLWKWFVVPLFHAPRMSVIAGIGCMLIVDLVTFRMDKYAHPDSDYPEDIRYVFATGILPAILFLAAGWAAHFFM